MNALKASWTTRKWKPVLLSVGHFCYLACASVLSFPASKLSCTVSGRCQSVNLLEFPREVTLIFESNAIHNLLDRQSRSLQKLSGLLQPERPKVVCRGHANLGLEQMLESRERQVYCAGKGMRRPCTLEILLHEGKRGSHARIHEAPLSSGKDTRPKPARRRTKNQTLL